ncbi:S1C family serine protease [Salirhabdus sp. Marseille-P4669]|uniref:S1C family serine protease n=1 Tax=Salirhabdus sp. Marseille-P4669 TaxID=2042310 RepID=UPI000C7A9202|nr:trypsin-like peptidase domain-containing protein [Salirhabdus sp. Marseille-P4669]
MGYYDDHAQSRNTQKKKQWFIPTLIGFIIGAVLVVLALPALIDADILPYEIESANTETNIGNQTENAGPTQTVNVDIQTQTTNVVAEVTEAVVGVVNVQGDSFWIDQASDAGTGSGVIYKKTDDDAFVVTNHHVIQGADEIEISLADGERVPAKLLGSDPFNDLAVLRIDPEHVDKVIELGNSDNLNIGEPVLAIGSPLGLQFSGSVTQGIISGKERVVPQDINGDGVEDWSAEVIQTDAAINPGNSGGALINMKGQLVGINSMKIAEYAVEGIGFSIPINTAKPILDDIEQDGKITRPYMGVTPISLTDIPSYNWRYSLRLPEDVTHGVIVDNVERMSPAAQAGLEPFDVIVELDGEPIQDVIDLRKHLYIDKQPGEEMEVTYYRNGEKNTVTITLSATDL